MFPHSVDTESLRRAAYAVAASESHASPKHRRFRAVELSERLLTIQQKSTATSIAKRLIVNCAEFEPLRELPLIHCERHVLSLAIRPQVKAEVLSKALQLEEEARHKALLGRADRPVARAIIWRVRNDMLLARRLSRHLRRQSSTVENGQVAVTVKKRSGVIVLVTTLAMFWLIFIGSLVPRIWDDMWTSALFCVTQAAILGYLFWPVVRALRQEIDDRDAANSKPHLQVSR